MGEAPAGEEDHRGVGRSERVGGPVLAQLQRVDEVLAGAQRGGVVVLGRGEDVNVHVVW
jgi:hypothetical protein